MNVVVGSAWRNAAGVVPRYMRQVADLQWHVGPAHAVRVLAVEGDSVDGTAEALVDGAAKAGVPAQVITHSHGGPAFGSTEAPERMAALTKVGNAILDGVRDDDDALLYVESDLTWTAATAWVLLQDAHLWRGGFDVFAPLVFAGEHFYDVFAYRKGGVRFGPFPPYHDGLNRYGLTEVDSVGSCLAMRAEVARRVRMPDGGVLVGFCNAARAAGYKVAVNADLRIEHPA